MKPGLVLGGARCFARIAASHSAAAVCEVNLDCVALLGAGGGMLEHGGLEAFLGGRLPERLPDYPVTPDPGNAFELQVSEEACESGYRNTKRVSGRIGAGSVRLRRTFAKRALGTRLDLAALTPPGRTSGC